MAGLVPAIHVLVRNGLPMSFLFIVSKDVDARDKPGHDDGDMPRRIE
jgi:hypothetical protein